MPSCQAYGCSNTSGKTTGKISYFHFPDPSKEKARAERWLHNIGTGYTVTSFKFSRSKVVCSDHFHDNCYETDMRAKVMGYESKRRNLKSGAVPTIFHHKSYDTINMDGETVGKFRKSCKRIQQSEHRDVSLY